MQDNSACVHAIQMKLNVNLMHCAENESSMPNRLHCEGLNTLCVQSARSRTRSSDIVFLRTLLVWLSTCIPYHLNFFRLRKTAIIGRAVVNCVLCTHQPDQRTSCAVSNNKCYRPHFRNRRTITEMLADCLYLAGKRCRYLPELAIRQQLCWDLLGPPVAPATPPLLGLQLLAPPPLGVFPMRAVLSGRPPAPVVLPGVLLTSSLLPQHPRPAPNHDCAARPGLPGPRLFLSNLPVITVPWPARKHTATRRLPPAAGPSGHVTSRERQDFKPQNL